MYRAIKRVELGPVLAILDRLPFIHVNQGNAQKYECDVVLPGHFPPELNALMESLELGGQRARAILRRLGARQSIPPHVDKWMPQELDWRRFQVPLTSHPDIKMRWPDDGVEAHLEPGYLYEIRFDRMHEVVNNTDSERIHLQVDQVNATI
jgi:hypothetical protein